MLFACFALTWVITRLGVYPTWILYSTTIEAPQIVEMFPAYYIFNGLLSILLVLHVIWTYFILKIIYKAMYSGKVIIKTNFLRERILETITFQMTSLFRNKRFALNLMLQNLPYLICMKTHVIFFFRFSFNFYLMNT